MIFDSVLISGKWIRIRWKWHQDAYWLDIPLPFYVCHEHPLCLTTISWSAHPKMVKCVHGTWWMANVRRMSNYHKCIPAFRCVLQQLPCEGKKHLMNNSSPHFRPIICRIVTIFVCSVMVIMRKFWSWIRSVWRSSSHWARKWNQIGYLHCMWVNG